MTTATESSTRGAAQLGSGRHALVITLDHVEPAFYTGWRGTLESVKDDRETMLKLLGEEAKYSVTDLTNAKATREAVAQALADEARDRVAGEEVVIYFSGHGTTLPDKNNDQLGVLRDGAWCLNDGMFVDDELTTALTKFPAGVRVVVISDSCHVGTILAASSPDDKETARAAVLNDPRKSKLAPVDIGQRVYDVQKDFYDRILTLPAIDPKTAKAALLVLSACKTDELARVNDDGSVFTKAIAQAWESEEGPQTYEQLYQTVKTQVESAVEGQHPQRRAAGRELEQFETAPAFGGPCPRRQPADEGLFAAPSGPSSFTISPGVPMEREAPPPR